ncbi:MAG: SMI1/KNR4 family protein, partial [Chlamydiia bacterium]|nr:SMI1/KNR4 family protein [Chlamydiia bacterium]
HRVIALHRAPELEFEEITNVVPDFPRGWYELAHLVAEDRIEFTREFWLSRLPFHPQLEEFLADFFDSVEDISFYLFQKKPEDAFEAEMVYNLKDKGGFFRGALPAKEEAIAEMKGHFLGVVFPEDYQAFVSIHNGFCKALDTGLIRVEHIWEDYQNFQNQVVKVVQTVSGQPINPVDLIPFYESFGMPFYQCFWTEWFPGQEMGNVYFSGSSQVISDPTRSHSHPEALSFTTFVDWLLFYLEKVEK